METISDGVLNQTEDYNYETYDYVEEEEEEYTRRSGQIIWWCVFYSVVLVVGLVGNVLLLVILAQKRRWWKVLDSFILQLGVVDILLLLTLPVWAAQPCENCSSALLAICRAVFNVSVQPKVKVLRRAYFKLLSDLSLFNCFEEISLLFIQHPLILSLFLGRSEIKKQ